MNQDRICEYVVLANGTMVANPSVLNAIMINSTAESPNNGTIATLLANGTKVQNATASPPPIDWHTCPANDFDGRCGVETATVVNRCPDNDHNNICEVFLQNILFGFNNYFLRMSQKEPYEVLKKKVYDNLTNAFRKVYPSLYEDLEQQWNTFANRFIQESSRYTQNDENVKVCKHRMGKHYMFNYGEYLNAIYVMLGPM